MLDELDDVHPIFACSEGPDDVHPRMLKVLTTSILMALPAIESFAYTPEDRAAGGAPPRKKARVTDGARAPARARARASS